MALQEYRSISRTKEKFQTKEHSYRKPHQKSHRTVLFLQARIGSTRLKRKILRPLHGKTLLEHVLDRLFLLFERENSKGENFLDQLFVVSSKNSESELRSILKEEFIHQKIQKIQKTIEDRKVLKKNDIAFIQKKETERQQRHKKKANNRAEEKVGGEGKERITEVSEETKFSMFFGSEENVLERFYQASKEFPSQILIRATADNPFLCIEHIVKLAEQHRNSSADFSRYVGLPLGAGVEIICPKALEYAYHHASLLHEMEHVTPYLYQNPQRFKILESVAKFPYFRPEIRLTIDELADFELAERIFQEFYSNRNDFSLLSIIRLWDKKNLGVINRHIRHKILQ